jgi:hypothetical protein
MNISGEKRVAGNKLAKNGLPKIKRGKRKK